MIFNRVLATAGDEDDVVHARGNRFLDAVLDDRLVDERQHFLGLRFGGWEKSGAEAGGREDSLADDGSHARIVAEERPPARIYNGRSMLDPAFVRQHMDTVRVGMKNRGLDPDKALEEIATLDGLRRRAIKEVEALKREANAAGDAIAQAKRQGKDTTAIQEAGRA